MINRFFDSYSSFGDHVNEEEDEQHYDMEAVYEGLKNFRLKKIFKRSFYSISMSTTYNLKYAFGKIKRSQANSSKFQRIEKKIDKFMMHLQNVGVTELSQKRSFQNLYKNSLLNRRRQVQIHKKFCNLYIRKRYSEIRKCIDIWRGNASRQTVCQRKNTSKKKKSQYYFEQKRIMSKIFIRTLSQLSFSLPFYKIKSYVSSNPKKRKLFQVINSLITQKKNLVFSIFLRSFTYHETNIKKDDPKIYENALKNICYVLNHQPKTPKKRDHTDISSFKLQRMLRMLKDKETQNNIFFLNELKNINIEYYLQLRQQAKDLQSTRLKFIEDFI